MSEQSAAWTGEWVAQKLRGQPEVLKVELVAAQVLQIVRKNDEPFHAGTIATACVEPRTFKQLLEGRLEIQFIANVPRESFWTGEAIEFASRHSVAWGGLGDLFSAVALPEPRTYVSKEFGFVERGLGQHTSVSSLERVQDRKYVVRRRGLKDMTVVLLNEYELTDDHVRTARERYGAFNAILLTNPNGGPTSSAKAAAESMGASVYKWGEFLGRLRRR